MWGWSPGGLLGPPAHPSLASFLSPVPDLVLTCTSRGLVTRVWMSLSLNELSCISSTLGFYMFGVFWFCFGLSSSIKDMYPSVCWFLPLCPAHHPSTYLWLLQSVSSVMDEGEGVSSRGTKWNPGDSQVLAETRPMLTSDCIRLCLSLLLHRWEHYES